jgi:ABC-2 type transport system permease protein
VSILKAIFLKGSSLAELALPIAALLAYALIVAALAARLFRKSVE